MTSESVIDLPAQTVVAARIYLEFGPAPLAELVRVLAGHLEAGREDVASTIMVLADNGELVVSGSCIVSLPAGGGTRDTKEK